jgi:hypothetical protein
MGVALRIAYNLQYLLVDVRNGTSILALDSICNAAFTLSSLYIDVAGFGL